MTLLAMSNYSEMTKDAFYRRLLNFSHLRSSFYYNISFKISFGSSYHEAMQSLYATSSESLLFISASRPNSLEFYSITNHYNAGKPTKSKKEGGNSGRRTYTSAQLPGALKLFPNASKYPSV